jgi:hypothetical protein
MDLFEGDPEEPELDLERLREAILYVCSLPEERRNISETKLHKILFYADREAYFELGESITGATYIRHQFGPYAEVLPDTLEELESDGAVAVREYRVSGVELGPKVQHCPEVFTRPNTDVFSEEERKILTRVAREIFPLDTTTVSQKSHDVVWESVEPFSEIPYYLSYLQVTEKDERDEIMDWAREKAQELQEEG